MDHPRGLRNGIQGGAIPQLLVTYRSMAIPVKALDFVSTPPVHVQTILQPTQARQ
jgi:hypothetical protein